VLESSTSRAASNALEKSLLNIIAIDFSSFGPTLGK
jgi:hypothetical protein